MRVPAACTLVFALALLLLSGYGVRDAALAEGDGGAYILVRTENGADSTVAAFACGEDIYTVNMNFAEDGSSEYSLVRNGGSSSLVWSCPARICSASVTSCMC